MPPGLTLVLPHPVLPPSQGNLHAQHGSLGHWATGGWYGAQATLTLVVRVELPGLTRNGATKIAGDQFDPNTSNNSDFVDITSTPRGPVPEADIEVRKIADILAPRVGPAVDVYRHRDQ